MLYVFNEAGSHGKQDTSSNSSGHGGVNLENQKVAGSCPQLRAPQGWCAALIRHEFFAGAYGLFAYDR